MPDSSPDIGAAVMLYIRACSPLISAFNPLVILNWPDKPATQIKVPPYKNVVYISTGVGGPGDIGLGMYQSRIDIQCYGVDRKTAYDMYRMVDYYLLPPNERVKTSFIYANCRVKKVEREGGFLRLVDADAANWNYTTAPYIFTFDLTPVS